MTASPSILRRPDRVYDGYVFDLDGTVYLGTALLPGAGEVIAAIRERGWRTVFLSNNPTRDPQMYADKLGGLGIATSIDDIVNPVVTVPRWLRAHHPDAGVFAISEEPLKRALTAAGVRLTEDLDLASYDRTFDYRKLQIAFDAIWFHRRARLITSNPDRYCPMPGGRGEPDAASVVAAIEACTQTTCEANLGKPGVEMLETVLGMLGLPADRCVMIGDRLSPDIAMAQAAGMDTSCPMNASSPAAATQFALTHTFFDWFTNYGHYMPRTHCMIGPDGKPDWLWMYSTKSWSVVMIRVRSCCWNLMFYRAARFIRLRRAQNE